MGRELQATERIQASESAFPVYLIGGQGDLVEGLLRHAYTDPPGERQAPRTENGCAIKPVARSSVDAQAALRASLPLPRVKRLQCPRIRFTAPHPDLL